MSYAALQNADLSFAPVPNFPGEKIPTNLTDADLSDAVLQGAKLSSAKLIDADLTDADLTDADLTDADLTDAKGWTREQLTAARSLEGATMPDGQKYEDWLKDKKAQGKDVKN